MKNNKNYKFDSFDWGWLVISFGMALGAGVVVVPVSVGVVGIAIYLASAIFAYPAIYLMQKLYMNTLFENKESKCYSATISDLIGKKFGIFLGIIYFIMMATWTIIYAEIVAKVITHYLVILPFFRIPNLEHNALFSLFLICILVFIGTKSQKLLFRCTGILTIILLLCMLFGAFAIIPQWNFANWHYLPPQNQYFSKTIIMLPFSLTTILFIQSLSPMVISYRKKYETNQQIAQIKAQKIMKIAFLILLFIVSFYIISFASIINQKEALFAKNHNESIFILLQHINKSNFLFILGIIINICAVLAAFLSILTGMRESLRGVLLAIYRTLCHKKEVSRKGLEPTIIILIILMTWLSIVYELPIFNLISLSGPIFGLIGCLIPAFLVYKIPTLYKYKGFTTYYIIFIGIILCISPLLIKSLS